MSKNSRRSFLTAGGVIPFAIWFESCGGGNSGGGGTGGTGSGSSGGTGTGGTGTTATVFMRSEAYTPAGQAMLVKYATAVNQMKTAIAEGDPTSWIFQWYSHAVRPDRTKAGEIARIYPGTGPNPNRDLANDEWSTCEPHFSGDEEYFVPWHRMFVYFFERIIRKVSGDPQFALPYWNYSTTGPNHGIVPPEFRQSGSSLFQANRNPGVNSGQPIDQSSPGDLDLTALSQATYLPNGADPGFNQDLDQGLHGNVHVDTGDTTNMGRVPWAAEDAVFWMHHCNIDRLWASWNKNGGLNPTNLSSWMNKQFIFADENGQKVSVSIKDFDDIAKLNYTYDAFEPKPSGFVAAPLSVAPPIVSMSLKQEMALRAPSLAIGTSEARATLRSVSAQAAPANQMDARVKNLASGKKLYVKAFFKFNKGTIFYIQVCLVCTRLI